MAVNRYSGHHGARRDLSNVPLASPAASWAPRAVATGHTSERDPAAGRPPHEGARWNICRHTTRTLTGRARAAPRATQEPESARDLGAALTSKAGVHRLPVPDPQPSASPPARSPEAHAAPGTESARGHARAGQASAQARGGLGAGTPVRSGRGRSSSSTSARRPPSPPASRRPALGLTPAQPQSRTALPTPRATRPRSARGPRPEAASPTPRSGSGERGSSYSPLPRLPRFSEAGADGGARPGLRRRPPAFLPSPPRLAERAAGKLAPQGSPRFPGVGPGPRAAGRVGGGRTCPSSGPCDVTRVFLGVPAPSRRRAGGGGPGRPRRSGVRTADADRSGAPPLRGRARLREPATAAGLGTPGRKLTRFRLGRIDSLV